MDFKNVHRRNTENNKPVVFSNFTESFKTVTNLETVCLVFQVV